MTQFDHSEMTLFFLALGILLGAARLFGELAGRFNQPAVIGEIFAGILLGPTLFGWLAPGWQAALFPSEGNFAIALEGLVTLSITLFLLVAGMEVDLSRIWRQGRVAIWISAFGMLIPFALGFGIAWALRGAMGSEVGASPWIFALFLGTALSISALPIIAKTLMDLGLYRSDLGMIVISAALVNDLIGWMLFAVILGLLGAGGGGQAFGVFAIIGMTLGFTIVVLTVVRWLVDKLIPWLQAHTHWPAGVVGFAISFALLFASLTSWIGIHAIFGAFIFGVALGDSRHLRERTRSILEHSISIMLAPIFFASIGLHVNFVENFDLFLVVAVLVIATVGKVAGCWVAGRWLGLPPRDTWAIGFGMNARGAMEIILALLALQVGLINEKMLVALVIMALATSLSAGIMIQRILGLSKGARFFDYLPAKNFCVPLKASRPQDAIEELAHALCAGTDLDPSEVAEAVWRRERIAATSLGNGMAVPHARIPNLRSPLIAVGISDTGIDFDSPDGQPARLVFLILTSNTEFQTQLDILSDIARTFHAPEFVEKAMGVNNHTEFVSLIKTEGPMSSQGNE